MLLTAGDELVQGASNRNLTDGEYYRIVSSGREIGEQERTWRREV